MHLKSKNSLNRLASLESRLWLCCGLFVMIIILAGSIILFEDYQPMHTMKRQTPEQPAASTALKGNAVLWSAMNSRRILFTVTVLAAGFIFSAVLKRILFRPIKSLSGRVEQMAGGNLAATVPPQNQPELNALGRQINALTTNFQEILLLVWNHCDHARSLIARLESNTSGFDPKLNVHLNELGQSLHQMQDMVQAFEFCDVHLENGKALSNTRADKGVLHD
jgi:methyl-accepting chemotaxis protein/aerotaxis receptor